MTFFGEQLIDWSCGVPSSFGKECTNLGAGETGLNVEISFQRLLLIIILLGDFRVLEASRRVGVDAVGTGQSLLVARHQGSDHVLVTRGDRGKPRRTQRTPSFSRPKFAPTGLPSPAERRWTWQSTASFLDLLSCVLMCPWCSSWFIFLPNVQGLDTKGTVWWHGFMAWGSRLAF